MAIDWATHGVRKPDVTDLRERMGKVSGGTSPSDWVEAIESFDTPKELKGEFESLSASDITDSANGWDRLLAHLRSGRGAILAVDYGAYRRLMPHKSGSETFNGNHAIFFLGYRNRSTGTQLLAWDPLNDGRRYGIPQGPVWVSAAKVKAAANAVNGSNSTWAVLVWRGKPTSSDAPINPEPAVPPHPSIHSVMADMKELLDVLSGDPEEERIRDIINDFESIIGPYSDVVVCASPTDEPNPNDADGVDTTK